MQLIQSAYSKLPIGSVFRNAVSRNISLIFFSNALSNLTMFVANIVIANTHSQQVFGLYSIATAIALTTLTVSEFGMNLTMVRLYKSHTGDTEKAMAVLAANFYFKAAVLGLLVATSSIGGKMLSELFTKSSEYHLLIVLSLTAGGLLGFWSYTKAFCQTFDWFHQIAFLTLGYAIARLAALCLIISWPTSATPELLFTAMYLLPLLVVIGIGHTITRRKRNFSAVHRLSVFNAIRESLSYSRWVAASGITFVLIQQSMILIAATIGDLKQVALLNIAISFASVFALLNDSWQQVLFPKVATLTAEGVVSYKAQVLRILPWFLVSCLAGIGLLAGLMSVVLGGAYNESVSLFIAIGLGTAGTIAAGLFSILVHSVRRPDIAFYVNVLILFLAVSVGSVLMARSGLLAMVAWYALCTVSGEIFKSSLVVKCIGRNRLVGQAPVESE